MSEKSIGSHLPVTLKYCSASATLVGNTLLIKRPKVLVPIHRADSLALKININRLDTKQPIYKQIKSNQFKNSIIFGLYVCCLHQIYRARCAICASNALLAHICRIFISVLCVYAAYLVQGSHVSCTQELRISRARTARGVSCMWALHISCVRAAHLENARFTVCARTLRIL